MAYIGEGFAVFDTDDNTPLAYTVRNKREESLIEFLSKRLASDLVKTLRDMDFGELYNHFRHYAVREGWAVMEVVIVGYGKVEDPLL